MWRKDFLLHDSYVTLENSADSCLCFCLALLHSVSYFFLLYWSPSSLCKVFDSISSNIGEVLWINPSANVFVFGDFNVHHKDWITYSGGTDRSGEFCYNFSISNDLTQMVNFPTWIPDCYFHSPLLDLYIFSDANFCSTRAFPLLENSGHVVVSVSIDLPSYSQRDAPFYWLHCLWLFSCWLGRCLLPFERCSMGGYL